MTRSSLSVATAAGNKPVGAEDVGGTATEYRESVQVGGAGAAQLLDVVNTAPSSALYGAVARAMLYDAAGSPLQQQQATYHAVARLAARPYALSFTTTANTRKQFATIHHAATAIKLVKLRRVLVAIESVSVAGIYVSELIKITTAPATGNPAITAAPALPSDPTAETTVLALPTTGGTESGLPINAVEFNLGITGSASVVNPPAPLQWVELFSEDEQNPVGEQRSVSIRAGVLEGWAVTLDPNAAGAVKAYVKFVFTEQ